MSQKIKVENCTILSIFDLRKLGFLEKGLHTKAIGWNEKQRVVLMTAITEDWITSCLSYRKSNGQEISYEIKLTVTHPHIGGKRFWFICPGETGSSCKRRVGKLYLSRLSDRFLCRYCLNLTYRSRFDSAKKRAFGRYMNAIGLGWKARSIKRKFYSNVPTKRYQRFMNKYLRGTPTQLSTFVT